jgi:phosphate transport system permease protein
LRSIGVLKFESYTLVFLRAAAWLSLLLTTAIVCILIFESMSFFRNVSFADFFLGVEWSPLVEPARFGIWPLVCGTLLTTGIAALIAFPLGLGIALYLGEYANPKTRSVLKPLIEVFAGIPSVVYGYFAVVVVSPVVMQIFPQAQIFNALNAGVVLAFMILPLIASLSDDAIRSIPKHLKDGGYALGANKAEVCVSIVIPAAMSGILSSFILAIARAVGETMAVTLAAGATPRLSLDPLGSVQTMTAYIVQVSMGDTPHGSLAYQSIFVVGLFLMLITLSVNLIAAFINKKLRLKYE